MSLEVLETFSLYLPSPGQIWTLLMTRFKASVTACWPNRGSRIQAVRLAMTWNVNFRCKALHTPYNVFIVNLSIIGKSPTVNNNIHQNEFLDFLTATCMMPLNVTGYILKRWPLGGPDHISCSIQARDHRTGSLDRYRNLDRSRTNFNQAVREFLISLCVFLLWIYFHRLPPCYHYQ